MSDFNRIISDSLQPLLQMRQYLLSFSIYLLATGKRQFCNLHEQPCGKLLPTDPHTFIIFVSWPLIFLLPCTNLPKSVCLGSRK